MEKQRLNRNDSGIVDIIKLIETLRGENGCPWDKKQTPKTMSVYLIEELYELVDAIESQKPDDVCEELGDVLFLLLFIVQLFQEMGYFDIKDVTRLNMEKMIRRHPHVFGSQKVSGVDDVKEQWHKIKKEEKNHIPKSSVLDSVPSSLPALIRAYRISERAGRAGFDWEDISGVIEKVKEEWAEFNCELALQNKAEKNQTPKNQESLALEFGDILFTLTNVARFANIHPETALKDSVKKFEKRFKLMEKKISDNGRDIQSVSRNELDMLWEEAKKKADF